MSSFHIRDENNLTEEEMLWLLENDCVEYNAILEEDVTSDMENEDHVSDHEEIDDVIVADDDEDTNIPDGPHYTAKDGTQWSKMPLSKRVRRSEANKIVAAPGLTHSSSEISTIRESFLLFFSDAMLDIIVIETNRKAKYFFDQHNATHPGNTKKFAPTNRIEIEAYIGLLITLGALQANTEPIEMLYCSDPAYCRPIIPACLSRNRYSFITKFIRYDNFETREQRKLQDRLAPIRDIFDILVSNCKTALNPSSHMCVDEQLVPFRGRAPFRVYMKSKPAKYGIKIWALADCEFNYTVNMQVYLGKQGNKPEKKQGKRVVLELTDHLQQGYGITTDNFFTSLELANKLLMKKLTLCGTLRKNKAFIPRELLPSASKKEYSSMFAFQKNCVLVSYVPKKSRAVILLSNEHQDDKVNSAEMKYKPDILLHYNNTKGAVDATDQMAQKYTTQRRTLRWPMVLFYHMIDIAALNAYKIWTIKNPNYEIGHLDARRKFLLALGKDLAKENIINRYNKANGLNAGPKENILKVFPELRKEAVLQERQPARFKYGVNI
ncbi:piggyBac transposable element-derived protein 4-like [Photinus pyralis]|uniref:piggyBac transposable element-derived protein 4-like n=1 Tax=Photinus pyralis TaxID=7054 RepID=UPI0012674C34|nr:piggyBac transposable element-derived protein 4-like [Photinus pyralis]XP_031332496.1 piggyBac transposable element-derived protein 4-like [Photinus pyralis]